MTLLRRLPVVLPILLLVLLGAGASAAVNLVPGNPLRPCPSGAVTMPRTHRHPFRSFPSIRTRPRKQARHTATLARLIEANCGARRKTPWLDAASEAEKQADPAMATLAVVAAERRAGTLTGKSCSYIDGEIEAAEKRAEASQPCRASRPLMAGAIPGKADSGFPYGIA